MCWAQYADNRNTRDTWTGDLRDVYAHDQSWWVPAELRRGFNSQLAVQRRLVAQRRVQEQDFVFL